MPSGGMVQTIENLTSASAAGGRLPSEADVRDQAVVLVCEPDEALRASIVELLRTSGFGAVVGAADLDDSASQCRATPPDVALTRETDDGAAVAGALRRLNPEGTVSVIHLYTAADREDRPARLEHADDILSLDRDLEALPHRVLTHATLRLLQRTLVTEHAAMEELIETRTERLNVALGLLREAEKRLQTELSDAKSENRNRMDYFAETQHEMRTPLNAICGMSDAIRKEMFGTIENPKYKEYADNIFQSGQHLLSIIDGRLELSRIEAGAEPLEIEEVEVGAVIKETTEMLGRIAEKANVALDVDIAPDLPVIETDRRKLRQVLVNLVSNAIKFTPEQGRVQLSVKRNAKKGVLVLVVSDTGIGMSPTDVRDAMKPYHRLSGDRRSGERGTGLGLTIVRKLVETLGATIEIQSKPGQGTSVKIELPMSITKGDQSLSAVG